MKLKCPSCAKLLQIPEAAAGKMVRCGCGKTLRAPAASRAATSAPSSSPSAQPANAGGRAGTSGTATRRATPAANRSAAPNRSGASSGSPARATSPFAGGGMATPDLFDELADKDFEPVRSAFAPPASPTRSGGPVNPYSISGTLGPDATGQTGDLATPGSRIGAFILDRIIELIVAAPFIVFGNVYFFSNFDPSGTPPDMVIPMVIFSMGSLAALLVHAVPVALRGQSLGKIALGIVIIDLDTNRPVGFLKGFLARYFFFQCLLAIPVVGLVLWVIDIVKLHRDDRHQTLHDQMARTIVCNVRS